MRDGQNRTPISTFYKSHSPSRSVTEEAVVEDAQMSAFMIVYIRPIDHASMVPAEIVNVGTP